jgi:hypothetical protein
MDIHDSSLWHARQESNLRAGLRCLPERRKEMLVAEEGFVKEHTLGGKAKEFLWKMEPGGAISIRCKFKNLGGYS